MNSTIKIYNWTVTGYVTPSTRGFTFTVKAQTKNGAQTLAETQAMRKYKVERGNVVITVINQGDEANLDF